MQKQNSYTSPLKKLVSFFEKSRDKWKEKYLANKKENQKLKSKLTTLKLSQQKWKNEAIQSRKQIKQTTINAENILPEPTKKNRN